MDIYQQLEELGLKDKQAKAYVALLKLQKASAHRIAKEAGVERTTIYKVLKELIHRQLVTETRLGKRIQYLVESPAELEKQLVRQAQSLKNLLPLLHSIEGKTVSKPTIKYYEGREAILKIYKDSLKCKEKVFRNLASVPNVENLLGDIFIDHYTSERIRRKIFTKSLRSYPIDNTQIHNWYLKDENKEVLRETRYLKNLIKIDAFIKLYDDTILLISPTNEPFVIIVESQELAQTMKTLFDIAWSTAKQIK